MGRPTFEKEKNNSENVSFNNSHENVIKVEKHNEFFSNLTFLLYGMFSDDQVSRLKKCILVSGGTVQKFMSPEIDYIISQNESHEWDRNMELALRDNSKVKIAKSQFIFECYK